MVYIKMPTSSYLTIPPSLASFIPATVAVIGFSPVLYTVEEGRRSLSVNVTHQIGALGRTVTLSVFTVDGSATGTVCVWGGEEWRCAHVCVGGWVWMGVWGEGRGCACMYVYVIVCGQFYFVTAVFYFVINLSDSSKRGVCIYYEVQHK